jgi:hypothetical protein
MSFLFCAIPSASCRLMKTIITHLLAVAIGVLAGVLLRPASEDEKTSSGESVRSGRVISGMADTDTRPAKGSASRIDWSQLTAGGAEEITASDFEKWLDGKKGDSRSLAEAQAMVGILTDNPDLIRKAIEADPENPHLLYIGATLASLTGEERLALSERFFLQDTQNGLAAYIYAAELFKSGDTKKGIEILSSSQDRPRIDAFATRMQLLMDDAYIAAGYSPSEAKVLSVFNRGIPYYSSLQSLAGSINDLGDSLPANEAADLRALAASMGMRLNDQASSVSFIDHLIGLKLEEKTLAGLANNAPSPYEGMTVEQARQVITNEREEIRKVMEQAPTDVILSSEPELVDGYLDRVRLVGELEATKWWLGATGGQK